MASSFILLENFRGSKQNSDRWMFFHQQAHNIIAKRLGQPFFNLYPFDESQKLQWLLNHQQAHNNFNSSFNLNSSDLQNVDLDDDFSFARWKNDHWQEHVSIDKVLGL